MCLQDDCNCLSFCRTFPLSSPFLSSTLFYFFSCLLVYPFSSTRSRQATRHLQQSLQTHCLWNRRLVFAQRHEHCIVYLGPFNFVYKSWELLRVVIPGIFQGQWLLLKIKDFTNLNFWKSIYCNKEKNSQCPKGIAFYGNISKSVLLLESIWSAALLGPDNQ